MCQVATEGNVAAHCAPPIVLHRPRYRCIRRRGSDRFNDPLAVGAEAQLRIVTAKGAVEHDRQPGPDAGWIEPRPPFIQPSQTNAPFRFFKEIAKPADGDRAELLPGRPRRIGGGLFVDRPPEDMDVGVGSIADIGRNVDVEAAQVGIGVEQLDQILPPQHRRGAIVGRQIKIGPRLRTGAVKFGERLPARLQLVRPVRQGQRRLGRQLLHIDPEHPRVRFLAIPVAAGGCSAG